MPLQIYKDTYMVGRPQLSKALSYRAILGMLWDKGPSSRIDIADCLDLSQPSVSRLVNDLLETNFLKEGGRVSFKVGRKQTLLDLNPDAAVVAGLSIRSKHIRLLLCDLKGHTVLRTEESVQAETVKTLIKQIRRLIINAIASARKTDVPLAAVTVGVSGAWDEERQRVHAAPNLALLEGVNLLELLEESLKDLVLPGSISVGNDVDHAALGELAYGAASGCNSFFYLNLGSGIGGGVVIDKKLYTGAEGFTGEIGYLPIYNGNDYQALETLVSSHAITSFVEGAGLGQSVSDFFTHVRAGHTEAKTFLKTMSEQIAIGLCSIVVTLNPELIVLGGSVGKYSEAFVAHLEQALNNLVPVQPKIRATALGVDASLKGAIVKSIRVACDRLLVKESM